MNNEALVGEIRRAFQAAGQDWPSRFDDLLLQDWNIEPSEADADRIMAAGAVLARYVCPRATKQQSWPEPWPAGVEKTNEFISRYGVLKQPCVDFALLHYSVEKFTRQLEALPNNVNAHAVVVSMHNDFTRIMFPPFNSRWQGPHSSREAAAKEFMGSCVPGVKFDEFWRGMWMTNEEFVDWGEMGLALAGLRGSVGMPDCKICGKQWPMGVMIALNRGHSNRHICPHCLRLGKTPPEKRWYHVFG